MSDKRPINQIVREIQRTWTKPYFGAVPYLDALSQDGIVDENSVYGVETAGGMVVYLLSNMQTFRGPDARRLKAELKEYNPWK